MILLRRLLSTLGGRLLVSALVLVGGFNLYHHVTGPAKIDDEVPAAVDDRGQVDVVVSFRFEPQRFHILRVQEYGRVSGGDERSLELRATTMDDVYELSRIYWVERIEILEEEVWSPS